MTSRLDSRKTTTPGSGTVSKYSQSVGSYVGQFVLYPTFTDYFFRLVGFGLSDAT